MATALLLVGVQRNMLEGSTPVPAAGQVRPALQSLLARARTAGALVVHIQNDGPQGSPDEPGTEGWELVFAPVPGELAVRKTEPDVFTADACLAPALTARGVDRVVVAGMQSNYCIAQTSRGALRHRFTVLLASGAHATYDEQDSAAIISASAETHHLLRLNEPPPRCRWHRATPAPNPSRTARNFRQSRPIGGMSGWVGGPKCQGCGRVR